MARTYQRYPAMRYHKTLAPDGREVKNAQQAAELGEGWVRTPAAFAPGYVEAPEPEDGSPIDEILAAGREYIPYPALRYTRDGQERVVHNDIEDGDLDPDVWRDSPDPSAWVDLPAAPMVLTEAGDLPVAPPARTDEQEDAAADGIYASTVPDVVAMLEAITDIADLDRLSAIEMKNPKGPRKGILGAVNAKLTSLMTAAR